MKESRHGAPSKQGKVKSVREQGGISAEAADDGVGCHFCEGGYFNG